MISYLLAFYYVMYIILIYTLPTDVANTGWVAYCDQRSYSLIYLIQFVAWFVGAILMTIEYKKRLSEAVYCHKLFWTMELIVQLVVIGLLWEDIFNSVFLAFSSCLNATMCLFLVVLMFRTKSRTFDNLRPETMADYNQGESPY